MNSDIMCWLKFFSGLEKTTTRTMTEPNDAPNVSAPKEKKKRIVSFRVLFLC